MSRGQGFRDGNVSTHAPRAGGDPPTAAPSTARQGFNPRPPRGRRHAREQLRGRPEDVSTHAPRAGGDRW